MEVVAECLDKDPWRFRFVAFVLGWGDLRVESIAQNFVHTRPFVAFRPTSAPKAA
jgi:hypothetical protein